MRVRGKSKRYRYIKGTTSAWKKAIVTLKAGDKIEIFEGQ
jgi:large subunit ribosomal protein L23